MNEEQIKQNANEYATKHEACHGGFPNFRNAFLAGAHSRDEEIAELKERLKFADDSIADADKWIAKYKLDIANLEAKLEQLRNPWISVEDMLPEEHSRVLIMFCNGTVTYNDYIGVGDINYMKAHSKTITHWMPIPALNPAEQLISGLQEMNQQFKKGE